MRRKLPLTFAAVLFVGACWTNWLWAQDVAPRRWYAPATPWHAGYYDPTWGMPVPLVVPPNAEMETRWGWGVGNTRVTPLYHQFRRPYPGPLHYDPRTLRPVPAWPSDTAQFGDYSVRGPW